MAELERHPTAYWLVCERLKKRIAQNLFAGKNVYISVEQSITGRAIVTINEDGRKTQEIVLGEDEKN